MEDFTKVKKRDRDEPDDEPELEIDWPDTKRLREYILDDFDDEAAESMGAGEELNVFMKIFQEEISGAEIVDLTSDCGDSLTDLGYLLEATDDELGLPPTAAESPPIGSGFQRCYEIGGEFWEEPSYEDPYGFGLGEADYIALDGLFDYSDMSFGSGDSFLDP